MIRVRHVIWLPIGAAVVLTARAAVYALVGPRAELAAELQRQAGGPHVAGALVGFLVIGAAVAVVVLWLAVVAVSERAALAPRRRSAAPFRPRLPLARLAVRVPALFVATSFSFAMLESTIHWRQGLGWHGLGCLLGPVHRDAVPVLAAFSLVAVAVHGAVEHVLCWARRVLAHLAARPPTPRRGVPPAPWFGRTLHPIRFDFRMLARGPPAAFVSVSSI